MDNQLKLGAVLLGGYLLGRTKKGGMAIRLATRMAMNSSEMTPGQMVRGNATKLIQSPETQDLFAQLRGQITQVIQQAVDARVQNLSENLNKRTEALTSGADQQVQETTDQAGKTAKKAVSSVTDQADNYQITDRRSDEPEDQMEDPEKGDQPSDQGESERAEDAPTGDSSESSEPEGSPELDDDLQERIVELKGLRITSLRKIAKKMFDEGEVDKIDKAEKGTLAGWIAEAEREDAAEAVDTDEESSSSEDSRPARAEKAGV
jgi:hypothetical protein